MPELTELSPVEFERYAEAIDDGRRAAGTELPALRRFEVGDADWRDGSAMEIGGARSRLAVSASTIEARATST